MELKTFMRKIYTTTGISIAASLGMSHFLATSSLGLMHPLWFVFGGLGIAVLGTVQFWKTNPIITKQTLSDGTIREVWRNSLARKLSFGSIIAGSSVMVTPLVSLCMNLSPMIVPAAAVSALLTMAWSTAYAYSKPLGEFRAWKAGLYGGLGALITINIIGLLCLMLVGPNLVLLTRTLDIYGGIALFTAFQIYDTHSAVRAFRKGRYDHLEHALSMFLTFKNLFVRLLSILR